MVGIRYQFPCVRALRVEFVFGLDIGHVVFVRRAEL